MRMLLMIAVLVAMGVVLCVSCGQGGAGPKSLPTGFVFRRASIGVRGMDYVVYVPRNYDPARGWPAVVFLHGSGESGTDGQKQMAVGIGTSIVWNADRWPCIVMMAQKPVMKDQWEQWDELVMKMLEDVRKEYKVDADRISLTGLSQGGHGTWSIGAAHPDVWCALAPICGYSDAHNGRMTAEGIAGKLKGVPMWVFHGETDNVVPPEQSIAVVDAVKKAGAIGARLTMYPGTNHGSWDKAYGEPELPGFLMTAKKK